MAINEVMAACEGLVKVLLVERFALLFEIAGKAFMSNVS